MCWKTTGHHKACCEHDQARLTQGPRDTQVPASGSGFPGLRGRPAGASEDIALEYEVIELTLY